MSDRTKFGQHEIGYEPETGFVVMRQVGVLDANEAQALNQFAIDCADKYSNGEVVFVLVDDQEATSVTREARAVMAKSAILHRQVFCAVFGSSFALRVVLNLIFKAISLTASSGLNTVALETQAEARRWLGEHRRSWLARTNRARG